MTFVDWKHITSKLINDVIEYVGGCLPPYFLCDCSIDTGDYGGALMSWAMQTNALSLPNTDSYVEAAWPALEERWNPHREAEQVTIIDCL